MKPKAISHLGRLVLVPTSSGRRDVNATVIEEATSGLIKVRCGNMTPWWTNIDQVRFASPPLHRPVMDI